MRAGMFLARCQEYIYCSIVRNHSQTREEKSVARNTALLYMLKNCNYILLIVIIYIKKIEIIWRSIRYIVH